MHEKCLYIKIQLPYTICKLKWKYWLEFKLKWEIYDKRQIYDKIEISMKQFIALWRSTVCPIRIKCVFIVYYDQMFYLEQVQKLFHQVNMRKICWNLKFLNWLGYDRNWWSEKDQVEVVTISFLFPLDLSRLSLLILFLLKLLNMRNICIVTWKESQWYFYCIF